MLWYNKNKESPMVCMEGFTYCWVQILPIQQNAVVLMTTPLTFHNEMANHKTALKNSNVNKPQ